jgi:hypothetical protein
MSLARKLGNFKKEVDTLNPLQPIAIGGFNSNNISSLPNTEPLNNDDRSFLKVLEENAKNDYSNIVKKPDENLPKNINNLIVPTIPIGNDYQCKEICSLIIERLWRIICLKGLYQFYTQESLQSIVNKVCKHDYKILQKKFDFPTLDMTIDLAVLALYDIIIFADDSSSMLNREINEDNLKRFDIMKIVVETIGFFSTLMDTDGIVVRFFNSNEEGNGIINSSDVSSLFDKVKPCGNTPMGEKLKSKIFDQIIKPIMNSQEISKPILIITITDGIPNSQTILINTICEIKDFCSKTKYGSNAVAFSFAQIGSDSEATRFLNDLDTHKVVGNIVDCTSEYSIEQKQCGPNFTPSAYTLKLLIGAIDPSYDAMDEN